MNQPLVSRGTVARPGWGGAIASHRVLRNTYALLSMTLLFSAGVAAASVALSRARARPAADAGRLLRPAVPGPQGARAAAGRLPAVFALTGFMGYTLGPLLAAPPGVARRGADHRHWRSAAPR